MVEKQPFHYYLDHIMYDDIVTLNFKICGCNPMVQAVWAGMQRVVSADNRSIFYCACAKFVTQFASKINCQVCCQMAWVLRE